MTNDINIHPQYITDDMGKKLSVIIPISEFDALLDALKRSIDTLQTNTDTKNGKNNAARFKGLLTPEEADKFHTYLHQTRNEWDRDI